jgi:hypothetical protein
MGVWRERVSGWATCSAGGLAGYPGQAVKHCNARPLTGRNACAFCC